MVFIWYLLKTNMVCNKLKYCTTKHPVTYMFYLRLQIINQLMSFLCCSDMCNFSHVSMEHFMYFVFLKARTFFISSQINFVIAIDTQKLSQKWNNIKNFFSISCRPAPRYLCFSPVYLANIHNFKWFLNLMYDMK